MKKDSFVKGTFIATFAIIITKIIGIIYVIPFYKIIGTAGGALYAYAYNVYQIFLSISTAGIPIAISKLVSEYNTLEMVEAKNRVFSLGKKMLLIVSAILFFALFTFAPFFAKLILGDITGGNSIEDVIFVIRCVSFSLLVVPFLSISIGYLQGHRMISAPSNSQIIEQIIRVIVILTGSYLIIKVYNGSLSLAVGISVFASFLGGLASYLYLQYKIHKSKKELRLGEKLKPDKVTNKEIFKKIIIYSIPLIVVSVATDIYQFIDMILLNRGLYMLNYEGALIENLVTVTTTWAPKISIIVNTVAIGMCTSLIPYITESFVKKDYKEVNTKFNKALNIILLTSVPMVTGLIILANPIFNIFYDNNPYGPGILRFVMINSMVWNFHMITEMVLQAMNKFKTVYLTTFVGFGLDAILDIPMILLFDKLGIPPHYGVTVASIISFEISVLLALYLLKKEYNLRYGSILKTFKGIIIPEIVMVVVLVIISLFVPLNDLSFVGNLLISVLYAIIGAIIYLYITYKNGILTSVLGSDYVNRIINKCKRVLRVK